jgi:hypothetical protein
MSLTAWTEWAAGKVSGSDADLGHGTAGQLERYVMGLLDAREQLLLETHVSGCLLCARALATEARREVALAAAIRATAGATSPLLHPARTPAGFARCTGPAGARRSRRYQGPLLAMAAALALVAGLGRQRMAMDPFSVGPGPAARQTVALATGDHSSPLLACLLDGEEALCPAAAGSMSDADAGRSSQQASSLHAAADFTGGLCRASDGTCALQSRPQ